jgi:hypothetical protein
MISTVAAFFNAWFDAADRLFCRHDEQLVSACREVERLTKMLDFESLEQRDRVTVALAMLAARESIDKALPKAGLTDESAVGVLHFMCDAHGIKH